MYIALEPDVVSLPRTDATVVWSAAANDVFRKGARPFREVQQTLALALQAFHTRSDADAAVWIAAQPWTDAQKRASTLVSVHFGTDAPVQPDVLWAFEGPLVAAGTRWSRDGIHPLPDTAEPTLAIHRGRLVQLWVQDDAGVVVHASVVAAGNRARIQHRRMADARPEHFVEWVKHALCEYQQRAAAAQRHRDALKLAFAMSVAERVVKADGVVDEQELAFLARAFPRERIEELWLDDKRLRRDLEVQARKELPSLLGYHEKLALLSTFFAACYADGRLEVRELEVLREASAQLGLQREDVVAHLKRLW